MTLVICPLHEVDEQIRRWRPSHIVSLSSPGSERALIPPGLERLELIFHDIPEPRPGLKAASQDDVASLIAFARDWPQDRPMLIQCWAGVSRSPAAAYVVACALSPEGVEEAWARQLRLAAPFATPNPRIVALADSALFRGGRMIDAIRAIGRGAETSLGKPFKLAAASGAF